MSEVARTEPLKDGDVAEVLPPTVSALLIALQRGEFLDVLSPRIANKMIALSKSLNVEHEFTPFRVDAFQEVILELMKYLDKPDDVPDGFSPRGVMKLAVSAALREEEGWEEVRKAVQNMPFDTIKWHLHALPKGSTAQHIRDSWCNDVLILEAFLLKNEKFRGAHVRRRFTTLKKLYFAVHGLTRKLEKRIALWLMEGLTKDARLMKKIADSSSGYEDDVPAMARYLTGFCPAFGQALEAAKPDKALLANQEPRSRSLILALEDAGPDKELLEGIYGEIRDRKSIIWTQMKRKLRLPSDGGDWLNMDDRYVSSVTGKSPTTPAEARRVLQGIDYEVAREVAKVFDRERAAMKLNKSSENILAKLKLDDPFLTQNVLVNDTRKEIIRRIVRDCVFDAMAPLLAMRYGRIDSDGFSKPQHLKKVALSAGVFISDWLAWLEGREAKKVVGDEYEFYVCFTALRFFMVTTFLEPRVVGHSAKAKGCWDVVGQANTVCEKFAKKLKLKRADVLQILVLFQEAYANGWLLLKPR